MSFTIDGPVQWLLFPDDREEGERTLLAKLASPGETWISAFNLSYPPVVDALLAAHARGTPLHIFVDHSQSVIAKLPRELSRVGLHHFAERRLQHTVVGTLAQAGIEVTVGTSDQGTAYIAHTKGVVVAEGDTYWCWTGSLNFSASGWRQVNDVAVFRSAIFGQRFVARFCRLRAYAWQHERRWQVMAQPPVGEP